MRKRLTARNVRAESQADGIFPGDIGNEERAKNYHSPDEYSNYDWQPGWDVPDPNAPKIDDGYDKIGFGIPKTADVYQTAKAAAVLAQMYLGDEAPDEAIEDQARDFMKLGHRRIVASIKRWKATEPTPATEAPSDPETCKAGSEEALAEDVKADEETATAAPVVETPAERPAVEDLGEIVTGDEEAPEMQLEMPEVTEGADAAPVFAGSEELNQAESDSELEALFSGEEVGENDTPVAKKASKRGIKHLGGQPKFASVELNGVKELEGIWNGLKIPSL